MSSRRYSSFNKRSEPEAEDPWSCVVPMIAERRPRSGESRKEGLAQKGPEGSQARPEMSRQASEDTSWEFSMNEAPIARLESLDELDQDHGS